MNILLGVTGSVAAIYTNRLVEELEQIGKVKIVLTQSGDRFTNVEHRKADVYTDADEKWSEMGESILHIDLRNWADIFILAPLSANTLAKISTGLCDNLLTEVVRAWDFNKPIIACPAMNTLMWDNPITEEQVSKLRWYGFNVMTPVCKTLACGDVGIGALPAHADICKEVDESVWYWPLTKQTFIPEGSHPGAFGAVRRHDIHTGVDLYCNDGDTVFAMEDGKVTQIGPFTGKSIGMDWWEETSCVMVRGKYGTVNYGEITPLVERRQLVKRGDVIGKVKRVLKEGRERPDIPHHSLSMLHLEYYRNWVTKWAEWPLDTRKPLVLQNPTHRLKQI